MKRLASPVGRRTETGSEAGPSRASGQAAAKLSRSTLRFRKSGARAGDSHSSYSGRSRLTSERATPTGSIGRRSEKSAEAIVAVGFGDGGPPDFAKGRTERRVNCPCAVGRPCTRSPGNRSSCHAVAVKPSTATQSGEAGRATQGTRRSGGQARHVGVPTSTSTL